MRVQVLGVEADGTQSAEIRANEISYRSLVRLIRALPGARVVAAAHNPINDDTGIAIHYLGAVLTIRTPFSDYIVETNDSGPAFDEIVAYLQAHKPRWWERIF
jgi:hypothetical protein